MRPLVIGVDPGPVPGVAVLTPDGVIDVMQLSTGTLLTVVRHLATLPRSLPVVLAVERFVVGRRATRSSTPKAGAVTRDQVGALTALAAELNIPVFARSASEVKPWASDARLEAAGALVKGMPHARDAARHALFCSVHDAGYPDPLPSRSPRST